MNPTLPPNCQRFSGIGIANAACLSGDIREECIGVYKLPLDDAVLPYVETPEALKRYAPDLKWVPPIKYPPTYNDAVSQLLQQRKELDTLQDYIAKGDLLQGGIILLGIIPKVNAAGKVIVRNLGNAVNKERNLPMKQSTAKMKSGNSNNDDDNGNSGRNTSLSASTATSATTLDMKAYRIEYALNELFGYLGETDVLIGQGLRGDLGVSAPAQIQILSSLNDALREFDELLRAVPDKI